jgi:hypothetical protein
LTSSDDPVRRLREESRLRIEQESRWRSFAGWCAVATLAGGVSLAALNAEEARLQRAAEQAAQAEPAAAEELVQEEQDEQARARQLTSEQQRRLDAPRR